MRDRDDWSLFNMEVDRKIALSKQRQGSRVFVDRVNSACFNFLSQSNIVSWLKI